MIDLMKLLELTGRINCNFAKIKKMRKEYGVKPGESLLKHLSKLSRIQAKRKQ